MVAVVKTKEGYLSNLPDISSVQTLLSFLLLYQDYYQFISTICKVQCLKSALALYLAGTELAGKVCSALLIIVPSRHSKIRFIFLVYYIIGLYGA